MREFKTGAVRDNHLIGYVECFKHWCRRWCKDRKWENK